MSVWLKDGEVLEGEGSGQSSPCGPRWRSPVVGGGDRTQGSSPSGGGDGLQQDSMSKAEELFSLCDKEAKGFITKRDMQRLQGELPLTPEQLESVFESLDRERNGFLTPIEFHTGLGELVGTEECADERTDPAEVRFTQLLTELGADQIFRHQKELFSLWCGLQRDRPDLLGTLEQVLSHAVVLVQDYQRERDSLEQTLRRREDDHDKMVRSLYEDMENQIKEEREKQLTLDSTRQGDKREQLLQELKTREQELEFTLAKQRELESRLAALGQQQVAACRQNQQLQDANEDLREQLQQSREDLHKTLQQLHFLQDTLSLQHRSEQRDVLKVSRNMQKERESLGRQLDLLRDMNKRLRDEKDAHEDQKRTPTMKRPLERHGSVIGDYVLPEKSVKSVLRMDSQDELPESEPVQLCDSSPESAASVAWLHSRKVGETGPLRVFKVVFIGSSDVGKSSFIHQYCRGHFPNKMSATVGIDFQVRSLVLNSTHIALQLWDTAGQERFRSITQQYYRRADGILAVYDITRASSFVSVRDWLDQIQKYMTEEACLMLLGNKTDKEERGERQEYEAEFFECSAKSGHNVHEAMAHLARLMTVQQDRQCESALHLTISSASRGRCCQ
ncbi:EF-hand calcium-binding domain-containing protein 4A isoform X2 [Brachyhypopomus gauderio]|uniref:EF-hand calcium-binding domain-containing protein 4A isoform X2 n=1 Tax=Brachyhypopomus gauderio TaxID=698409 RepID=UPI00404123DC